MNKAQLVEAMASEAKMTKVDAKSALDAFVTSTTKALRKGERVALVGFGSFAIAKRAARTGRNPQTGKAIKIAAKKVVKFKAGSELATKVK
ncbi:MAG: HU family DNA-binding protein [Bacteroidales bacterium]